MFLVCNAAARAGCSHSSLAGTGLLLNYKRNQESAGAPEEVKAALDARDAPIADDSTRVLKLKRAAFQDIFEGDTPETAASLDLGKVQMFYVTVALVLGYGIALGALFAGFDGSGGISELPNVDQAFVGLLGISHVGYLATKAAS
jgi:hypothetical protein